MNSEQAPALIADVCSELLIPIPIETPIAVLVV
jgi:hypothetical protein